MTETTGGIPALLLGEHAQDPYTIYSQFRPGPAPLIEVGLPMRATASHRMVSDTLRDSRFSSDPRQLGIDLPPELARSLTLLHMDGPEHARLRRIAGAAFTTRAIAALEPVIRSECHRLLTPVLDATGEVDLLPALAWPLPIAVIAHLLGADHVDHEVLARWGAALGATLEPKSSFDPPPGVEETSAGVLALIEELIDDHRRAPRDDVLSWLLAAEDDSVRLCHDELVMLCRLLLLAGFVTTVGLLGNGINALIAHPDQQALLRADRGVVANAVEEMLRYDSPIQATSRIATCDLTVGDQPFPRGSQLMLLLGGANRDETVFPDPDRFLINRPGARTHVAFAGGIHHCLGAPLARLEARVLLEALLDRTSAVELTRSPRFAHAFVVRHLTELPAKVTAR